MATEVKITIDKFLGLNLDNTGDTNLEPGELSYIKNAYITDNYKIRKRHGYLEQFDAIATNKSIRGMWYGKISGTYHFLFACNGHVYKHNLTTKANTDLGTLTDARTVFFAFADKVYILNGNEYKYWSGTGSIATVDGYIPLIATATPPAGGGTANEAINLLTGKKHQTFSGNNSSNVYQLAETSITSVDAVYVAGVLKTVTTHYTVDTTAGTVTFTMGNIPTTGVDNVNIYWTKGTGFRSTITAKTDYNLFGGQNDTRVFLYGDNNFVYFSDLANGLPSAEYFPADNYNEIGTKNYKITYITRQYNKQVIFTENDTWFSTYDYDETLGANFPVTPVNGKLGNKVVGQGQLIRDNPVTFMNEVYEWVVDDVRGTQDGRTISKKVQIGLDTLDLTNAITFDYQFAHEYWLCVGNKAYIFNYQNGTWYYYELYDVPSCFVEVDGDLYIGTTQSQIMKYSSDYLTDNGLTITAEIETGNLDFGQNYKRKFLNFIWIGLQPETKSEASIEWESDYSTSSAEETIQYTLVDFGNVDYDNETYYVNYNPQPFRLKIKAKKYTYLKIKLSNDSDTHRMTILNITMPALLGGVSK